MSRDIKMSQYESIRLMIGRCRSLRMHKWATWQCVEIMARSKRWVSLDEDKLRYWFEFIWREEFK